MNVLLRAVVSGFGFSLGAALYKKAAKKMGIEEASKKDSLDPDTAVGDEDDGAEAEE